MINEILPLREILQVKRNKSRIDKWQGPVRQTLNCNYHELIHRGYRALQNAERCLGNLCSFILEQRMKVASLHGCHGNVSCYLKYLHILKVFLMLG